MTPEDLALLRDERHRYYAHEPIPAPLDAALASLIDRVAGGGAPGRAEAARTVGEEEAPRLLAFAERSASLAVRDGAVDAIRRGLTAIGLVWEGCEDPCDALPPLGLLHASARRIGASAESLFEEAAGEAPTGVAGVFRDFLTRPDLGVIAEQMGYLPGEDAHGFRWYRTW